MRVYTYPSTQYGFQLSIPDDWFESVIIDSITSPDKGSHPPGPSIKITDSRTIVGPHGRYLNMLITPLLDTEHEPTIDETAVYFGGLQNRQNLSVMATGSIKIAGKEHFWATYSRGFVLTLTAGGQMQFFKKYCIFLHRVEYLFTGFLYGFSASEKPPTDQELRASEKVFDEMVSSMELSG